MARRHRIQFPGAIYHITIRGNRKTVTFIDDIDRHVFLKILAWVLNHLGAECFAYCLMSNHVHLVICTSRANISWVMHRLNTRYAKYLNKRHNWTGHVFEGPFRDTLIEDTSYLRNALAYVARNPVKASLVQAAADWQWSSFRAAMGHCAVPSFLTLDWIPRLYVASTLQDSRQLFAEQVAGPDEPGFDPDVEDVAGGADYKGAVREVIGTTLYTAPVPRGYRALSRPPLCDLFNGVTKVDRRAAILRAHVVHGYLMSEIARHLDLHATTVSRIVNQSGTYRLTRT
jgi:putative transposase